MILYRLYSYFNNPFDKNKKRIQYLQTKYYRVVEFSHMAVFVSLQAIFLLLKAFHHIYTMGELHLEGVYRNLVNMKESSDAHHQSNTQYIQYIHTIHYS